MASAHFSGSVGDIAGVLPGVDTSDPMADFLQFASESHEYSVLENSLGSMTPNMPEAIRVLEGNRVVTYVRADTLTDEAEADADDEAVRVDEDGNPITLNLTEAGGE